MDRRLIIDDQKSAHFVTTLCYHRRRLLDDDRCKGIVVHVLADQLVQQQGLCMGFVIMPDHAHAMVWFPRPGQLSHFMKQWKQRSSVRIKKLFQEHMPSYAAKLGPGEPVWQRHYHSFNLNSEQKCREKLSYMHNNPVRRGLVAAPGGWRYSSARHYEKGRLVGVPIAWPGR